MKYLYRAMRNVAVRGVARNQNALLVGFAVVLFFGMVSSNRVAEVASTVIIGVIAVLIIVVGVTLYVKDYIAAVREEMERLRNG